MNEHNHRPLTRPPGAGRWRDVAWRGVASPGPARKRNNINACMRRRPIPSKPSAGDAASHDWASRLTHPPLRVPPAPDCKPQPHVLQSTGHLGPARTDATTKPGATTTTHACSRAPRGRATPPPHSAAATWETDRPPVRPRHVRPAWSPPCPGIYTCRPSRHRSRTQGAEAELASRNFENRHRRGRRRRRIFFF